MPLSDKERKRRQRDRERRRRAEGHLPDKPNQPWYTVLGTMGRRWWKWLVKTRREAGEPYGRLDADLVGSAAMALALVEEAAAIRDKAEVGTPERVEAMKLLARRVAELRPALKAAGAYKGHIHAAGKGVKPTTEGLPAFLAPPPAPGNLPAEWQ